MFPWFRSKPAACPIDAPTREWIDDRWKWLEQQFGLERLRTCRVILPLREYFPDPYNRTEADARRMLERTCGYLDIDQTAIDLTLYEDKSEIKNKELLKGRKEIPLPTSKRYRISVEISYLNDPLALAATILRELSLILLAQKDCRSVGEREYEPLAELLTIFLGLGVITANAAVIEKVHQFGVFLWQIGRTGYLDMRMFGYALALFARARGEAAPDWAKILRLDVRTAFKQSMRFLDQETMPAAPS